MRVKSLRRLDDEQANEWLHRQSDFYTHNKNQAYRLIQLVIGAGSILAILLTNSAPFLSSLIENSQNGFLYGSVPGEVEALVIQSGYLVAGCLMLLFTIYVIDSVQWSFNVLQTPKPQPGLGGNSNRSETLIEVGEYSSEKINDNQTMYHDQLSNWLNENKDMLEEMDKKLNRSYKNIALGSGLLITGGLTLFLSYSGNSGSVTVMLAIIVYVSHSLVKSIINAIKFGVVEIYRNKTEDSAYQLISEFAKKASSTKDMNGSNFGWVLIIRTLIYVQSLLTIIVVFLWIIIPNSAY